jgi:hypothetical protein
VQETNLAVPSGFAFSDVEQIVENGCTGCGLRMTLKGTLAQYPGSIHWHWKKGGQPGVLELTAWPGKRRLWFTVHENRRGAWIEAAVAQLKSQLEASLQREGANVVSDE